jgi:hypothetical protein
MVPSSLFLTVLISFGYFRTLLNFLRVLALMTIHGWTNVLVGQRGTFHFRYAKFKIYQLFNNRDNYIQSWQCQFSSEPNSTAGDTTPNKNIDEPASDDLLQVNFITAFDTDGFYYLELQGLQLPDSLDAGTAAQFASAYAGETRQIINAEALIAKRRYRRLLLVAHSWRLHLQKTEARSRKANVDVARFQFRRDCR